MLDVTFPGPAWDGVSPLPLACGSGQDHPAGEDPDATSVRSRPSTVIDRSASR